MSVPTSRRATYVLAIACLMPLTMPSAGQSTPLGVGHKAHPDDGLVHRAQQTQDAQVKPPVRRRTPKRAAPAIRPEIGPTWREMPRTGPLTTSPRVRMKTPASWAYQLAGIEPQKIESCAADVFVVDYSADGTRAKAFTRDDVERMRRRSSGRNAKIIAYMSIGEAESYRDLYWKREWLTSAAARPKWLGPANDEGWGDNYRVRYWDPAWQKIIFGSQESYLDRLIATGFDGVYLDIVDGFEFWQDKDRAPGGARRTAPDDMIEFVTRIARHAWSKAPEFLIVPQNGEALLESDVFRAHISAIGVEDTFFRWSDHSSNGDDVDPQSAIAIHERLQTLGLAVRDEIPVLAVEYLADQPEDRRLIPETDARMRSNGLVPHFAERQLGRLTCPSIVPVSDTPTARRDEPPAQPPTTVAEAPKPPERRAAPPSTGSRTTGPARSAAPARNLLSVDWADPEIAQFMREKATNPPRSVTPATERQLSGLALPVIAFDRPPGAVTRALGVTTAPKLEREIVTDRDNPVWYHIVDRYQDITITVDADLRVQQKLPADTPIYTQPPSASAQPAISIIDDKVEEGMEGLIAEYVVHKFGNIPYRVTVECSKRSKDLCRDADALLKDREQLRIISARPPQ